MIATSEWRFSALEFAAVWETMRRDRLPFPFTWGTKATTAEELARERAAAARPIDDGLADAVSVFINSVVRVQTFGFVDGAPAALVHAAIGPSHAVVAAQTGERIGVRLVQADDVVSHISLPPAAPGTERAGTVASSRAVMTSSDDDRRRLTHLLNRKRSGGGELVVGRSSRADCCIDDVTGGFTWIDVAGDGRYVLSGTDPATVTPATDDAVTTLIRRYVAETV